MKTTDVVPAVLSDCFVRISPAPSSLLADDSSSNLGTLASIRKLDVLQYVQYLRFSTKLNSNQIFDVVSNHVEKLGICASVNCVKKYVKFNTCSI